jgi:hypothetical protein
MEEAKFNNLCSHYKDTSDIQQATIKQRDMLFYRLLVILAVFTLQLSSTDNYLAFLQVRVSSYIVVQFQVPLGSIL